MKKKIIILLLVLLLCLSTVFITACNKEGDEQKPGDIVNPDNKPPVDPAEELKKAQDALQNYIFTKENAIVSGEFILPGTIGSFEVVWTSSNADAVSIVKVESGYRATVDRTAVIEQTEVKLTVAIGEAKREFKVRVAPISAIDFVDSYNFTKKDANVSEDFTLDTSCTYAGKTASITWTIDEKYADSAVVENNTVKVMPGSIDVTVEIKAHFTYNGETLENSYKFIVTAPMTHEQLVDQWYTNVGAVIDVKGYIVAIGKNYENSAQYGEQASVYVVCQDFCSGYYFYNVACPGIDAEKLVPGAAVIVTGVKSYNYNGLMEGSGTGTLVLDTETPSINVEEHIYALDNDLMSGTPAAIYHQSALVSLTGWKVESVATAPAEYGNFTIFTLKKGDVKVPIRVSKYMHGSYTSVEDQNWKDLVALCSTLKVGDIVNLTGVAGYYNGFQLMPRGAADVVKVETETEINADVTSVGAVMKSIVEAVEADFGTILNANKDVTLPASANGVTVEYELLSKVSTITLTETKVSVKAGKAENAAFKVTVSKGDYSTFYFFTVSADASYVAPSYEFEGEGTEANPYTVKDALNACPMDGSYTSDKFYVTGTIKEIATKADDNGVLYGNMYIEDGEGNSFYIYGTFNADGSKKYGEMENAPVVGDTIVVYGILGSYNGTAQMKNGWIMEGNTAPELTGEEITVAKALEVAGALADEAVTETVYKLTGKIVAIPTPYDSGYKNISVTIEQEGSQILVYRLKGTGADTLKVDDTITIVGKLKNYKGTLEVVDCEIVSVVDGGGSAPVIETITVAKAVEIATALDGTAKETTTAQYKLVGTIKVVDEPYSDQFKNVTFTLEQDGATIIVFRYKGTGADTLKAGDTVTLVGQIQNYEGKFEFINVTMESIEAGEEVPPTGSSLEDPYTVAEILALGATLEEDAYHTEKVYVKGIIKSIAQDNGTYLSNVYLVDEAGSEVSLLVYSANYDEANVCWTNDTVIIFGYLQNYKGKNTTAVIEITKNGSDYANVAKVVARGNSSVTVSADSSENATVVSNVEGGENGTNFTITVTAKQGYALTSVKVNGAEVIKQLDAEGKYTGKICGPTVILVATKVAGTPDPVWTLVTDLSTLTAGDQIIIVSSAEDYAMGVQSGNYRAVGEVTKTGNTLTISDDVVVITLEAGTKEGTFALKVSDGYLAACDSSSNKMTTKATLDDNASWMLTMGTNNIVSIAAQGEFTRNLFRFNHPQTGAIRFCCYGSSSSLADAQVIYKLVTPTTAA